MSDEVKDQPEKERTTRSPNEPLSPDDLIHMYGGFLFFVAVPVMLVLIIVYLLFFAG